MSDTLQEEIAPFGLRSICFDSGCFRTPVLDKRPRWKSVLEAYSEAGKAANDLLLCTCTKIKYINSAHQSYEHLQLIAGHKRVTLHEVSTP